MDRRRGFTLVELLTVVSIVAVLVALLLPAIQSVRERARRMQCVSNLTQLGTALANYASTHGTYPPGVVAAKGPLSSATTGSRVGWPVQILPFLEQANIHRHLDLVRGAQDPVNSTVATRHITVFACPSDPIWTATSSYVGGHHDVEAPIDVDNHGLLFLNSHVAREEIRDGPAFTILVGEHRNKAGDSWASADRSILRNTGVTINGTDLMPTDAREFYGAEEEAEAMQQGVLPSTYVGGFSSHHPGGANFLFADGSIHFLREGIDLRLYRRLGHRDDGELIGGDQY